MERQKTLKEESDEPPSNNRGSYDVLRWVGLANVLLLRQSTGRMVAFNRRVPFGIFSNLARGRK